MSEHTKRPWVIEYKPGHRHYVHGPDHNAICKMSDSRETEESKANARLISASPDLLEALKKVLNSYEEGVPLLHRQATIMQANQAISKAEAVQ